MSHWAQVEFEGVHLGDKRMLSRLTKTAEALSERAGKSLPQVFDTWADTEAAYRLFENPHVPAETILDAHFTKTAERAAAEPFVTVIADPTDLDFTGLKATEGLGHLSNAEARGHFFAVLVANPYGQPLGLIDGVIRARDLATKGAREDRRNKPTAQKESQMWLDGLAHAQERLPEELPLLYIADAGADEFDLFAAPRRPGVHLLVRSTNERRVDHPARLLRAALAETPVAGEFTVEVGRGGNRAEGRLATLSVKFERLTVLASEHSVEPLATQVELYVVLAEEIAPPAGVKPIRWQLLTTLATTSFEEACQRTRQYAQRWLIERYFYTLKSGCRVEELQLASAEQLTRAASLFCVVAWRLLWLTHESRRDPHQCCEPHVGPHEWRALYAYHYPKMKMPDKPPTLREAIRLVAKLGGFLGRKGDGEPGVKVIWQGFAELEKLARLYRSIARNPALCQFREI